MYERWQLTDVKNELVFGLAKSQLKVALLYRALRRQYRAPSEERAGASVKLVCLHRPLIDLRNDSCIHDFFTVKLGCPSDDINVTIQQSFTHEQAKPCFCSSHVLVSKPITSIIHIVDDRNGPGRVSEPVVSANRRSVRKIGMPSSIID